MPCDGKVIMSAGLPGAGKTTVLTSEGMNVNMNEYATISSDDFKEMLAEENAIPQIEGLSQMECSTLVHSESSYLADKLLSRLADKNKNIIYDFTCKNPTTAKLRMNQFLNKNYSSNNIQLVFVSIHPDIAQERAKFRYRIKLNESITDENSIGGRYLPPKIIDSSRTTDQSKFFSINAESVITLSEDPELNLPEPKIFDNSGTGPIQKDFKTFKKGEK